MRSLQQFWSVRRIGEDRVTLARLGPLRLWLARADMEWGFASHYGEDSELMDFAQVPEDVVPDDLKWTNILFRDAPRDYVFEAVAPQKPMTIRTMHPIGIPSGESSLFYLAVPVFIRIRVILNGNAQTLGLISSEKLRRSWFGSQVDGVSSYANPMEMQLDLDRIATKPNQIIYRVEIKNSTNKMLGFDKVCLDLRKTGLYSGTEHLWGNPVQIEYLGQHKEIPVTYSETLPDNEKDILEVARPGKIEIRDFARYVISCCNLR